MTEMTATERATHDRIMAAPPAPESWQPPTDEDRRHAHEALRRSHVTYRDEWAWQRTVESVAAALADERARAAIAALQGPDSATAALQRVEALAEELEADVEEHAEWRTRMAIRQIVADLHAALRGESR